MGEESVQLPGPGGWNQKLLWPMMPVVSQAQPQRSDLGPPPQPVQCHVQASCMAGPHIFPGSLPQVPAPSNQRSQALQGKHPSICLTLANLPLRPQTDVTQMSTEGGQGTRKAWKVARSGTRQMVAALLLPKDQVLAAKTLGATVL